MSEMISSSPSAAPDTISTSSTPARPRTSGTRTARSPRTTKAWRELLSANGPRLTRSARALRSVMTRTSTRRLGRRPPEPDAGSASATVNCRTPFSTVGKTSRRCRPAALVDEDDGRHPGVQPAGVDVGDGGVDAERRQVGDARDDVAAAHQRAFLRQHPRQHAVAIRLGRRQVEEAPGLRRLPCRASRARATACRAPPASRPRRWRAAPAAAPARSAPASPPARSGAAPRARAAPP